MSYPTLPLSQSFRFPPTIAQLAYEVLYLKRHLGLNRFPHIVGKGKGGKVVSRAILARSNMGLIEAAIEELENKRKMYFEGNFNSYLYSGNQGSLYDVLFLYAGQHAKIHSDLVRSVRDFSELEQYASDIADPDLRLMCRLVKKYKTELFGMLDELKRLQPARPEDADLILQTVHRAKGLEYDSVILADDFISPAILKRTLSENDVEVVRDELNEELNILYVAVTRAKRQVEVPDTLATLLPQDKPAGK